MKNFTEFKLNDEQALNTIGKGRPDAIGTPGGGIGDDVTIPEEAVIPDALPEEAAVPTDLPDPQNP